MAKSAMTVKTPNTLEDLFWMQMADLRSAEEQLTEALPKMAAKATNPERRTVLGRHLDVTRVQLDRLQRIFSDHGREIENETCNAMEDLIAAGALKAIAESNVNQKAARA